MALKTYNPIGSAFDLPVFLIVPSCFSATFIKGLSKIKFLQSSKASIQVHVALGTTSSRREIRTEQPGRSQIKMHRQGHRSPYFDKCEKYIHGNESKIYI